MSAGARDSPAGRRLALLATLACAALLAPPVAARAQPADDAARALLDGLLARYAEAPGFTDTAYGVHVGSFGPQDHTDHTEWRLALERGATSSTPPRWRLQEARYGRWGLRRVTRQVAADADGLDSWSPEGHAAAPRSATDELLRDELAALPLRLALADAHPAVLDLWASERRLLDDDVLAGVPCAVLELARDHQLLRLWIARDDQRLLRAERHTVLGEDGRAEFIQRVRFAPRFDAPVPAAALADTPPPWWQHLPRRAGDATYFLALAALALVLAWRVRPRQRPWLLMPVVAPLGAYPILAREALPALCAALLLPGPLVDSIEWPWLGLAALGLGLVGTLVYLPRTWGLLGLDRSGVLARAVEALVRRRGAEPAWEPLPDARRPARRKRVALPHSELLLEVRETNLRMKGPARPGERRALRRDLEEQLTTFGVRCRGGACLGATLLAGFFVVAALYLAR